MNPKIGLSAVFMAVLIAHSTIGEAGNKHGRRAAHHASAGSSSHQKSKPFGAGLNEEQSLRALESEVSRKLGSSMQASDYPDEARREGWSGTTRVDVLVGNGRIKEVSVQESSGHAILDEQAIRAFERVRLWWIPQRLRNRDVTVTVPVAFYIRETPELSADLIAGILADRIYLAASHCRNTDELDSGLIASLASDLAPPVRPVPEATLADWTVAHSSW
jgi:TonB family protein